MNYGQLSHGSPRAGRSRGRYPSDLGASAQWSNLSLNGTSTPKSLRFLDIVLPGVRDCHLVEPFGGAWSGRACRGRFPRPSASPDAGAGWRAPDGECKRRKERMQEFAPEGFALPPPAERHERRLIFQYDPQIAGKDARPITGHFRPGEAGRGSVAGGVLLVALLPLMALIACAIRLETRGPVFFRQIRRGRDGRMFRVLKFRTMFTERADPDAVRAVLARGRPGDPRRWLPAPAQPR